MSSQEPHSILTPQKSGTHVVAKHRARRAGTRRAKNLGRALWRNQKHAAPIENKDPALEFHEDLDKGHGRMEIRRCWRSEDIGWLTDAAQWEELRNAGVIQSMREIRGKTTTDRRITSAARKRMQPDWHKRCAVTDRWKINSTGQSTSSSTRPKAGPAQGTVTKTLPACALGASTCCIQVNPLRGKRRLKGRRKARLGQCLPPAPPRSKSRRVNPAKAFDIFFISSI